MDSILVTGATSRIGRTVVSQLLAAGAPVRALTRRPELAGLPAEIEVVAGDLTVPESIDAILKNVSAVFLLWTAGPATVPAIVERLASRGVRVVFLSSPHQTPHPFFQQPNPSAAFHAEVERLIATAGVAATILRPGMFASNTRFWWGPMIQKGDIVRWPYAAAETAPIDDRDIGAVAVRALTDDSHAGRDYVLTGPESLSHADQVHCIGSAIGRRISYEEQPADEFRAQMMAIAPGAWIDMLLNAWHATIGHEAYVTTTVADVVGRPARTYREWVLDHADAFRSSGEAAGERGPR